MIEETKHPQKPKTILRKAKKPIKLASYDLPLVFEFRKKIYEIKETPRHGLQMT